MEIKDLELKLLAGIPVSIPNVGSIHPLTCKDVADMGMNQYYDYINHLCVDIDSLNIDYDKKEELKSMGLKSYDIIISLCLNDEKFLNTFIEAMEVFFSDDVAFDSEYNIFILGYVTEGRFITGDNYEVIKSVIKKMNCIQSITEDYNPGNERAKRFIEKLKKNRANQQSKPKDDVNLYSIISGIAWKSHIGIKSVWDLTIYQLYDAHDRLHIVDNYEKTMHGIYAGTVDSKKVNIKEINWSKTIKN